MLVTIHNNSRYTLAVHGNEFSGLVAPGASIEVPQDVAKIWLSKPTPSAFRAEGLVRVHGLEDTPAPVPGNNPTPKTPAKVAKATAKATAKDKPVHWKTMLRTVSGLDDLDALQELHASESRPRILTAIESRMTELQGA